MPTVTVYITDEQYLKMLDRAKREGKSKAQILREALSRYLELRPVEAVEAVPPAPAPKPPSVNEKVEEITRKLVELGLAAKTELKVDDETGEIRVSTVGWMGDQEFEAYQEAMRELGGTFDSEQKAWSCKSAERAG